MTEQQIKEKYIVLAKVNEEIASLTARKSGLVREINIELIAAKEKSDKLISEAEERAKAISVAIDIEQSKATEYVEGLKKETTDLFAETTDMRQQVVEDRAQLDREKEEFDNLKVGQDMDIKDKLARIAQVEADNKTISTRNEQNTSNLDVKEAVLNDKGKAITEAEIAQDNEANRLLCLKDELLRRDNELTQAGVGIAEQKKDIIGMLEETKAVESKIAADSLANKKLMEEILAQKQANDKDKKVINAHFERIEKDNKENEERKIALDEREQLLDIKNEEIVQKIGILTELRKKGG